LKYCVILYNKRLPADKVRATRCRIILTARYYNTRLTHLGIGHLGRFVGRVRVEFFYGVPLPWRIFGVWWMRDLIYTQIYVYMYTFFVLRTFYCCRLSGKHLLFADEWHGSLCEYGIKHINMHNTARWCRARPRTLLYMRCRRHSRKHRKLNY